MEQPGRTIKFPYKVFDELRRGKSFNLKLSLRGLDPKILDFIAGRHTPTLRWTKKTPGQIKKVWVSRRYSKFSDVMNFF